MSGITATAYRRLCLACVVLPLLCVTALAAEPAAKPEEHPLDKVIRWAEDALAKASDIKDYTTLLIKRERVDDQLQDFQYMQLKVRHEPFSVYLKFLKPDSIKGREVIYVQGRNDGMLLAHDVSVIGGLVGTVSLSPTGFIAMRGQRYPLTMIGFKNLGQRLIEEAKRDRELKTPTEVKWIKGAAINGRPATCIEVTHPVRTPDEPYALARTYVDIAYGVPVRYEGYGWPEKPGGERVLLEEYTYSQIQLNVGLSDQDFDPSNPQYNFK